MANTVDERIVEAKFDASDFEKGVNKTIKKLDELKKSLNLEDAGKNITEFAKETSEGVNKAESALQRLSDRFTTFKGMLKQQILSGLAQEFSNAVLSIERSIAGLVKSISSDQVGAGMNKYTEILNSVRTMTAAGIDQTRAYEAVKRLGDYSDQTSYSLSQMTSAMSKLVASGMEIEKAEKSVEGLANMAASAGVNIYDAQRAFVNFSQAYSSGTMRIQDWTSFESLNMGTQNVMKVFMQAAEEVGTLTKTVDKNGNEIYKTTNKVNKAVKAGKQVATSGFRDTLSYGWLDKKTMEQATAVLSYFEDLEANINDLTEEELAKFSTKAFQAAKEARSFADVMGTVKDVVATGWATSFEIIFGKLDKATEFFTWLSESRLAEAIYSIGEFRNAVLTAWGTDWAEGGIFRKRDENGNFGTGRDMLVDTLKNIDELIGSIHEGLEDLFPEEFNGYLRRTLSFPEILGKNLGYFTRDIRDASKRLLDFFTIEQEVTEDGETKQKRFLREDIAARIGKIGQGLASVIGVFNKLYKIITETFEKVFFKVQSIIGAIGDAIGTIMEPFTKLNADTGFFKDFTNAIDNFLIVLDPVLKLVPPVIEFLGELGAFFADNAIAVAASNIEIISGALGLLIEMFGGTSAQKANDGVGVIKGWTNGIKEFGESCREGLTAIKEFFKALFDDIRTLLGIGEQTGGEDGGFFAKISNFFQTNEFIKNVRKWVSQAIKDVQKFVTTTIPKTLSKLPSVVQSFFHSLFYKKKMVWNGQNMEEKEVPTALKEWLDGAVNSVQNFISSIPSFISRLPSLIGEFIHSLFWQKAYRYNGSMLEETEVPTELGKWLAKALDDAKTFLTNIPTEISKFFSNGFNLLQTFIDDLLYDEKETTNEAGETVVTKVPSKLKEWIDQALLDVQTFIGNIPTEIGNFFTNGFNLLQTFIDDLFYDEKETTNESGATIVTKVPSKLKEWIDQALLDAQTFLTNIPTEISKFFSNGFNLLQTFIDDLLYDEKETTNASGETIVTKVPTELKKWIDQALLDVQTFIGNIPTEIGNFFTNGFNLLQTFIDDLLYDEKETTNEAGETVVTKVPSKLKEWIDQALLDAQTFIGNIPTEIGNFFTNGFNLLQTFIDDLFYDEKETTNESGATIVTKVPSKLKEWIDQALLDAQTFLTNIPTEISKFFSNGFNLLQTFIDDLLYDEKETTNASGETIVTKVPTELKKWIDQALLDAQTFLTNIPTEIGNFFTNGFNLLQTFIDDLLYDEKETTNASGETIVTKVPSKLNAWLKQAVEDADHFIRNDVPEAVRALPSVIGTFVDLLTGVTKQQSTANQSKKEFDKQIDKFFIDDIGNAIPAQKLKRGFEGVADQVDEAAEGFNLWESIKKIGGAIKDAFVDLGPDILAGLKGAFEWIGGGLNTLTSKLNEVHGQNKTITDVIAEQISDENTSEKDKNLFQAIRDIGQTIFDFITVTIPQFISAAVTEVQMQIPKILSGLFSGEGIDSSAEGLNQMFGFGGSSTTRSAGESKTTWFSAPIEAMQEGMQAAQNAIQEAQNEVDHLNTEEEKIYITREEALRQLNTQWRVLKGELSKEYAQNWEGFNIDDFDTKTILGDARRDKAADEIARRFKELSGIEDAILIDNGNGNFARSEEFAEDKEKSIEGITGFVSDFMGIVTKVTESDTVKVVAICVALMFALSKIRDLLSITDEVYAMGEGSVAKAKWHTLELALAGIIAIVGWVTSLAADTSDAGVEKMNRVETMFTHIANFVKELAGLISEIVVALAWKEGLGALGDIADAWGSPKGGITGIIGDLIERLAGLGLISVGADAVGKSFESLFESMSNMLSDIGSGIDEFMVFLEPAISKMADLSLPLDQAIQAVDKIGQLIGKFYDLIGIVGISVAETDEKTKALMAAASLADPNANKSAVFLAEQLDQRMAFVFELSTLMNNLANSFKTMESIDDPAKQIGRMMDVLDAVDEKGVNLFAKFIEKLSTTVVENIAVPGRTDLFNFSDFSIGLSMLGDALSVFRTSISGLTVENVTALDKTLDVFNKLAESFRSVGGKKSNFMELVTGDNSLGTFGKQIKQFGTRIQSFFDNVKHIKEIVGTEEKDINSYNAVIEMVIRIANGMAEAATKLSTHTDADKFTELGNALPAFGTHLAYFCTNVLSNLALNGNQDISKLNMVLTTVDIIQKIADAVSQMAVSNVSGHGGAAKLLGDLMSAFTGEEGSTTVFSSFLDIVKNLMTVDLPGLFSGENDLYSVGFTAGSNLDAGLADGIAQGTAVTAAEQLAEKIKTTVPEIWQEQSPSKLFTLYGQYLDEGLANGILAYQSTPIDAASEMATEAVNNTTSILETIKDLAISDMDVTPTITPVVDLTNMDNASEYIDGLYHPGAIGLDLSGMNRNVQSAIPTNYQSTNNDINFAGMINDLRSQIAMLNGAIGTIGNMRMDGLQVVLDSGVLVGGIIDKVDSTLGRRGFYAGRE